MLFRSAQPMISKIQIVLYIITFILMVSIIIINRNIKESIKTLAITLLTVGIINILVKLILSSKIQNILILNETFSESIVYLANSIMNTFFITGIIMFCVGIGLAIVSNLKK